MRPPSVPGVLEADDAAETVDAIAGWQLPSGMIPWFPGGHADPWNHVECAMALHLAGRRAEAERAFEWLVANQRDDGAWWQYYWSDGSVKEHKLDANCCAYVATGVLHHWLCFRDMAFCEAMWPVVERAIDFALGLQTPRGEIIWARHRDGTPWSFALLTGSSSICHSLRCAIALAELLGRERPDWELALVRLSDAVANQPDAFAPKERWAMDWYYPVLSGALSTAAARRRLGERFPTFVMEGRGVRCVADRPWVTAAETCECAIAHLVVGDTVTAERLLTWAQHLRADGGHYFTGMVFPQEVHFPGGEKTTYTAAAVVLAADALSATSPASGLLVGEGLPEPMATADRVGEDVERRW